MNLSAQDLRNIYQKLYAKMRDYLWPYDTLETLANIEVNIFSAFVDIQKLRTDCGKLYSAIKDTCKEDEELAKIYNRLAKIIDNDDIQMYSKLPKVTESHPEKSKQLVIEQ